MRQRDLFWMGSGMALGFALGTVFPRLRQEFGPLLSEASARASEMATEMTAIIAQQIEQVQSQYQQQTQTAQYQPTEYPEVPTPERAAS